MTFADKSVLVAGVWFVAASHKDNARAFNAATFSNIHRPRPSMAADKYDSVK